MDETKKTARAFTTEEALRFAEVQLAPIPSDRLIATVNERDEAMGWVAGLFLHLAQLTGAPVGKGPEQLRKITDAVLTREKVNVERLQWLIGERLGFGADDEAPTEAKLLGRIQELLTELANSVRRPAMDLIPHLARQRAFSERTFGPGDAQQRFEGIRDHILKELRELEEKPMDTEEWIDVAILALDGAWRSGASPEQIAAVLSGKQAKNEARTWPDWRTATPGKAIEHVRDDDRDHTLEKIVATHNANVRAAVAAPLSCSHQSTITKDADEIFESRVGCLDCDTWLQPIRVKHGPRAAWNGGIK